jgi:hypothetical protein
MHPLGKFRPVTGLLYLLLCNIEGDLCAMFSLVFLSPNNKPISIFTLYYSLVIDHSRMLVLKCLVQWSSSTVNHIEFRVTAGRMEFLWQLSNVH